MSPFSTKKVAAVMAYLLAAWVGAVGQYLFKIVSQQMIAASFWAPIASWELWLAIACYIAVMLLFMLGLRLWNHVSSLYPIYGTTFIWAAWLASVRLGESIGPRALVGMLVIVGGIALLNAPSAKSVKDSTS